MKKMKGFTALQLIDVLFVVAILFGYGSNLVQFIGSDFEEPYKAEVIRGIGVVVPPVGIVSGYLDIDDTPK